MALLGKKVTNKEELENEDSDPDSDSDGEPLPND